LSGVAIFMVFKLIQISVLVINLSSGISFSLILTLTITFPCNSREHNPHPTPPPSLILTNGTSDHGSLATENWSECYWRAELAIGKTGRRAWRLLLCPGALVLLKRVPFLIYFFDLFRMQAKQWRTCSPNCLRWSFLNQVLLCPRSSNTCSLNRTITIRGDPL